MESQITATIPTARPHLPAVRPHDEHGNGAHEAGGNGHPPAEHDGVDLDVPHPKPAWVIAVSVTGVILLAILLVVGLLPRVHTSKELAADAVAALNAPVPVNVVTATRSDATMNVMLPGTLRPWQEVSIYARSTGYLKKFYVDISNQVTKGQLMADISTPEIDQQVLAAQATLKLQQASAAKAQTDLDFAQKTNERYQSLKGTSGVTQLELDQFQANYNSAVAVLNQARAQVGVAEATVRQLTEMQAFEQVNAPFSGVVTGRAYDVGAYIIANPTTMDILPMFKLAENDVLRAFVNVPQNYSLTIQKGMKVTVTARERPGRKFIGEVLGTTNYLDPMVRSLLTEIRIENPDFAILPGMYVQAEFHVIRDHPPLIIPAPAMVSNADGNFVSIVKDNKVHFIPVTLGVDFGNSIEILSGLTGDEQIIGNPGEKTIEGAEVKIAGEKKDAPGV